jgi:hypothetical protein
VSKYLVDTNIWIDVSRTNGLCARLQRLRLQAVCEFALAPPVVIEIFRGVILGGGNGFQQNKNMFGCSRALGCEILELPLPFITKTLGIAAIRRSGVEPAHYEALIETILTAPDYDSFIRTTNESGGVWRDICRADEIHRGELERELNSLQKLGRYNSTQLLATRLSAMLGPPGCRPKPFLIEKRFSAALEFLQASIAKTRSGANPLKNDPGMYIDFQILFYLGDPNMFFLTKEDFSHEIRRSAQRAKIMHPEKLLVG